MFPKIIYFKDDKNSGFLLSEVFSIKEKPSFDYLSAFNAFNFDNEKPIKIKNKEELKQISLIITSVLFNYIDIYNIDKIQIKNYYIQYIESKFYIFFYLLNIILLFPFITYYIPILIYYIMVN